MQHRITVRSGREIQNRNCRFLGCEAPIPCNLKCRRNRKTDSQSSAWRLVHGQHPKLIAETREATTSPGARASSPWPRVCRTRCGRSAGQRVSIAPGQGPSPYQSPVNGVVVQVSLQHAAEPRAGINDERLAAVRYAVSYRAILALRESIVTRRIVKCGFRWVHRADVREPEEVERLRAALPRRERRSAANRPNFRIRVFSSFSERPNSAIRSRRASRRRRTSVLFRSP
ncbi:hypothetical protein ABIE71_002470 [Bradyrhizobium diazoefficiens]